jgi:predicted MFS family arabinose efflux permease
MIGASGAVSRPISETGTIVLACLLYTAGSAFQYITPAYLSDLGARLAINEAQMGSISAAENIGIGLASLLTALWGGRLNRRYLAIGAAIACAGFDMLAFFSRSFEALAAVRFLTGFLGEGILFSLAFLVLRSVREPDRSLGIALTAVVIFSSLVLGAAPFLNRVSGASGVLIPLALLPLTILFAARWMPPPAGSARPANTTASGLVAGRWAIVALAAMAVWFAAPGAFWTFAETEATGRRIPVEDISLSLAIGNAVGLLGSLVAAFQANRWGRASPIAVATICLCLSAVAFEHSWTLLALAAALSAVNIFWNYGAVYQMGLVVALDPAGGASAAISASQVLGFAAGGFTSGLIIFHFGFSAYTAVVSVLAFAGLLLFAPCFGAARRRKRVADAGSASG